MSADCTMQGGDFQHKPHPIRYAKACKNALKISSYGMLAQAEFQNNFLVSFSFQKKLDDFDLLRR